MAIASGTQRPSFRPVTEGSFRWLGRGDAFLGSRQLPRHLILPRGLPGPAVGLMPCLLSVYAKASWRQAKVCLRPLSFSARTEPPGRHHSSTGSPYEPHRTRFLEHLRQRRSDPNCFGTFSITG